MKLHCKWVKNNSSDSEHGKFLTLRLDFLNCAIFKYQPYLKMDISKSIYPFHVKLLQISCNLVLCREPHKRLVNSLSFSLFDDLDVFNYSKTGEN